jgi:hypothetical protein
MAESIVDISTADASDSRPEEKTNQGWANFWDKELIASKAYLDNWRKAADKTVKIYIDDRGASASADAGNAGAVKLNLFNANVNTIKSMLYGRLPVVSVTRRFADPDDDVARVAANLLERMLNNDLQVNGEEYNVVLRGVLEDRLVPGMGAAVVRYSMAEKTLTRKVETVETDDETGEQSFTEEEEEYSELDWEDASVDYQFWGDLLWGWTRNWSELRWVGLRHWLTEEEAKERFPSRYKNLTYKRESPEADQTDGFNRTDLDSISRTEVWEIWDKESGKVFWHQAKQTTILDSEKDPLELEGFFPLPPFLIANITTSLYRPTPDYWLAKDLYTEINRLETRIAVITEAVKVVGIYDKQSDGIQRMLKEGGETQLIPVENWALNAEKGGLKGTIEWFPVETVANVLNELVTQRNDTINLLYQVTGMSDILRGASTGGSATATEQELKGKFASVRIQALQDEFAQFCSDALQLKAEIICKHFSPETIVKQSNAEYLNEYDKPYVPQALALIKQPGEMYFRVLISPESVAMVDFAKKQAERTEYIQALGFFMQSSAPLVQESPEATPYLLELLKWGLAGFKGSDEIEGVLDAAIDKMKKNPPGQKKDPKAEADQAKVQVEQMKAQAAQAKSQADMQQLQMKGQLDQQKFQQDMAEQQASHQADMAKIMADFQATIGKLEAQTGGAVIEQQAQTEGKLIETAAKTEAKLREQANAVRSDSD